MSEILKKDLKNAINKNIILYLENGFRFECCILFCDDEFLKIFDYKKQRDKYINLNQIAEVDFI